MRVDGEIDTATFAQQSQSVRDELANLHLQITSQDRSAEETADLAIKSFELSQALTTRRLAADVRAKRQILEAAVLNFRMEGRSPSR